MYHNSTMKAHIFIAIIFVFFHLSNAFMGFSELGGFLKCYNSPKDNRISNEIINGQTLPLPNSIETFISLVERLESLNSSPQPTDIIRKLLMSFRVNEVPADLLFQDETWEKINFIEKAFFNIDNINYAFKDTDVSEDEKCALHLMLSHSINDTLQGMENEESIEGVSKHPKELGVVSLHGKKKHAFAIGKVLLGIYAGLMGNNELDAVELSRKIKNTISDDRLNGIKINRLIAVTIADLVTVYIGNKNEKKEISFMPNGEWKDTSCTTDYLLEDNNKTPISNSLIRGAIDGIIIGRKMETNPSYRNTRLSEILRMYYGPTGLMDSIEASSKVDVRSDFQWCRRRENFRAIQNIEENILNYLRLNKNLPKDTANNEQLRNNINDVLQNIQSSSQIFDDISDESSTECGRTDTASEKCKTPADIFPILDWATNDNLKNFQIELLGHLSTDFEIRPYGNSIGAYTNLSPMQSKGLHVVANNTGIAGCSSCYLRHNKRATSLKQGEVEVMINLNHTLTEFDANQDSSVVNLEVAKRGTSAKVVLYFNSGSPTDDYRLRDALWEIEKSFREVTILAIGSKKESLQVFTRNDDTDIFTENGNVAALALKLKTRICKVPAEFRFKECYKNTRGSEADNKQSGFIPINKKQYWAMYPKYFLKSLNIKLKFKALDGAQIKVCFSRSYYRITEDGYDYKECRDSSGEVEFTLSNPCYRKNVHNCDPFYFSIEGVKPGTGLCESFYCRSPKDIVFEFSHEGVSCNSSSLIFSSSLLILISILFSLFKRE